MDTLPAGITVSTVEMPSVEPTQSYTHPLKLSADDDGRRWFTHPVTGQRMEFVGVTGQAVDMRAVQSGIQDVSTAFGRVINQLRHGLE